MDTTSLLDDAIATVRRFNRFYTRQLGLLDEGLLRSAFSLAEARVLYELAQCDTATAADLRAKLGLDGGYLSRILKSFEQRGLLVRSASPNDGRQSLLGLTEAGQAAFQPLDQASQDDVRGLIGGLSVDETGQLIGAMRRIETLLNPPPTSEPYLLRGHRIGDIGWITRRQALLYAQEYGWGGDFEASAAEILAGIVRTFDPARDGSWIAEREGEIVGSVFVVHQSETEAKLRMLYVESSARGLGIGRRLVRESIRFARERGYRTMMLWTHDVLVAARNIYRSEGFKLISTETHTSFGKPVLGEFWELTL